jgi:molybdopterin-guanine dinucleotide biosynthesis protein
MVQKSRSAMKAFSVIGACAEKSELVRRLVVELTGRGLRVSTIKRVTISDLERPGRGTCSAEQLSEDGRRPNRPGPAAVCLE